MTTAEQLLTELEESVKDLVANWGTHEGSCTNEFQMRNISKVAPCTKHESALEERKKRVDSALMQFRVLRDIFSRTEK